MNVKIVFLNENLEEDVYMDQPIESIEEGKEHMVSKLKKWIHGLKQAFWKCYLSSMILLCPTNLKKKLLINVYIWM